MSLSIIEFFFLPQKYMALVKLMSFKTLVGLVFNPILDQYSHDQKPVN